MTIVSYDIQYNLIDATPYDGCNSIDNSSFNNNAILLSFNSTPVCPFQTILRNLKSSLPSLVIIGLVGKIVSEQKTKLKIDFLILSIFLLGSQYDSSKSFNISNIYTNDQCWENKSYFNLIRKNQKYLLLNRLNSKEILESVSTNESNYKSNKTRIKWIWFFDDCALVNCCHFCVIWLIVGKSRVQD